MRFRGKVNWFTADQVVKIEPKFKEALDNYSEDYMKPITLFLIADMQKHGFRFFDSKYTFTPGKSFLKDGIHVERYDDPAVEIRYRNIRGKNRVVEIGINFWHIL
jgi:hypothetical protein